MQRNAAIFQLGRQFEDAIKVVALQVGEVQMQRIVVGLVLILLLIGCQNVEPTATPLPPTAVPTDTPPPTNTPTATATNTPSPTATPSPTNTPTATPTATPTNTPSPTNTASPTATPSRTATAAPATATQPATLVLLRVSFSEAEVLETVLQIAAAQGLPLSAETSTLTLQDGLITVESTQTFLGQPIRTVFVVRLVVVDGEPVATLDQATVSGESLSAETIALIEVAISEGFATALRISTNYTTIHTIEIADGLLTVTYQ